MTDPTGRYTRKTEQTSAVDVIDVLWLTAGLGCDGDTIAMTAATQPSIEDLVAGAIPGVPRMRLHNPVLAYENGNEFLEVWHRAATGAIDPFILVVEGSIPNERNKNEGFWAGFGTDPKTGQPITTCQWLQWLAPRAWAVVAAGTCSSYGGIHAMEGNPTGCMGLPDFLGWKWQSKANIPIICIPGCPVQPDNMTESLLYLLSQAVGRAPMIPLDDNLRPPGCSAEPSTRAAIVAATTSKPTSRRKSALPKCIVKQGCWGPVVQCNVSKRGMDGRHRRLRQRWRGLHRLYHARLPRQVHAVPRYAAGCASLVVGRVACTAKPSAHFANSPGRR